MQYLLLIYEDEAKMAARAPAEQGAVIEEYRTFTADIIASGAFQAGEALLPAPTAKSVRVKDGQTVVTDGPFAETREQLGGFYMVEAESEAEACAIAARIPAARTGTIEVRAVMVWESPDDAAG